MAFERATAQTLAEQIRRLANVPTKTPAGTLGSEREKKLSQILTGPAEAKSLNLPIDAIGLESETVAGYVAGTGTVVSSNDGGRIHRATMSKPASRSYLGFGLDAPRGDRTTNGISAGLVSGGTLRKGIPEIKKQF